MARRSTRLFAALCAASLLVAGCTAASGVTTETVDPPTSTAGSPTPSSGSATETAGGSSSSSTPPSQTTTSAASTSDPATEGLSATEIADRKAAEAQWIKSWDVYLKMARVPAAERRALAATVTVEPSSTNMLTDARQMNAEGLETYGQIGHRISWTKPINGADTALISDCQDGSKTGSLKTATGKKVSVGVPRDHFQGTLVRGDDGIWRVHEVFYLKAKPC